MGYRQALEAAGAEIEEYKEFGSYQGTWFAVLTNGNIVEGAYGSCSGCDAFESEFGYKDPTQQQLCDFGLDYLRNPETVAEAVIRYSRKIDGFDPWSDDEEIFRWLQSKLKYEPDTI